MHIMCEVIFVTEDRVVGGCNKIYYSSALQVISKSCRTLINRNPVGEVIEAHVLMSDHPYCGFFFLSLQLGDYYARRRTSTKMYH